jgi:hypothetical protein
VKVSTATFESAQYISFRHIHINFYVSCIHVGIPMMIRFDPEHPYARNTTSSLHISIIEAV